MSTPLDDMSDDELIEKILKLEESIHFYEMAYKAIEIAILLECFKSYRRDKKTKKRFRGKA